MDVTIVSPSRPGLELEEDFLLTDVARLKRWLPWLLLFRAFRVAIHHRRMFVGIAFVWLVIAGTAGVNWMFGDPVALPDFESSLDEPQPPFVELLQNPWHELSPHLLTTRALYPLQEILRQSWKVIDSEHRMPQLLNWLWLAGWTLLAGGLISRMAALEVTQHHEASLRSAVGYVFRHAISYLGGPLTVVCGFLFFAALNALLGVIGCIPGMGPYLIWLGWPLALVSGVFLAMLVVGFTISWPLMICTTSTEGTDPFDGLSRSYNYLFVRPWYALFLMLLLLMYGGLLLYFVEGMVLLTWQITVSTVAMGGGLAALPDGWLSFWKSLLGSIPLAFAVSLFWTAMTIVYLLLRKSEDSTPLDVVDMDTPPQSGLPLVGVPAAARREAARQATADDSDS